MAKLDKKQPYFSVHGSAGNAAFEQGGRLFDVDGEEVVMEESAAAVEAESDTSTKAAKAPRATKAAKAPKSGSAPEVAATPSVVDEQLAAQGAA